MHQWYLVCYDIPLFLFYCVFCNIPLQRTNSNSYITAISSHICREMKKIPTPYLKIKVRGNDNPVVEPPSPQPSSLSSSQGS